MKKTYLLLFLLLLLFGAGSYFIASRRSTDTQEMLKNAFVEYTRGETAVTIGERSAAFNKALALYTELEQKYKPNYGNEKLYYNIANCYFQLGEYPTAALYYYKALKLNPRDEKSKNNLFSTQKKLGIDKISTSSAFKQFFFFHDDYSLPEKLRAFFLCTLTALLLASFFNWYSQNWLKKTSEIFSFISGILLLNIGYTHFLTPESGVIINSSSLYRDAGFQYAKVSEEPILSGKKVEVVDILNEGKWFKITTPEGKLGYIPLEAIKII